MVPVSTLVSSEVIGPPIILFIMPLMKPAPSNFIVVVELSGLESDDPAMLAALEQARSTLAVTS